MNAFLEAVLADPDNDAPRLVYADHLSEGGHPRGELISLQIAVARGKSGEGVAARISQLIDVCWQELASAVRAAGVDRFCVRRGFVEAIGINTKRLDELPTIMRHAPVQELQLTGPREGAMRLAQMRELLRVRTVDLTNIGLGNRRCAELLRSEFFANVSSLKLSGNGLGPPAIRALLRAAPNLPCLEHLYLDANKLGPDAVEQLVRSPLVAQLLTLQVDDHDIGDEAAEVLERSNCGPTRCHDSPYEQSGVWFP